MEMCDPKAATEGARLEHKGTCIKISDMKATREFQVHEGAKYFSGCIADDEPSCAKCDGNPMHGVASRGENDSVIAILRTPATCGAGSPLILPCLGGTWEKASPYDPDLASYVCTSTSGTK